MRLVVPVLSVAGVACALAWVWFNGQLHVVDHSGAITGVDTAVLSLLTGMLLVQTGLLYILVRNSRQASAAALVTTDTVRPKPDAQPEQVNTEWVLDA